MTRPATAQCVACARYYLDGTCEAYPSGIPDAILIDGGDHRQPYPGDSGLRFSIDREDESAVESFALWELLNGGEITAAVASTSVDMLSSPNGEEVAVAAPVITFSEDGTPVVPSEPVDADAFARERDVNEPGGVGHQLRNYWVRGEGAAKIRWGTDGSFARCVAQLGKYVKNPQGLCAEYHKAATGEWPAEKGVESVSNTEVLHGTHNQEDHGNWVDNPLSQVEKMEAYRQLKERFNLKAKNRDALDRTPYYPLILKAAHDGEWERAEALMRDAGVIPPAGNLGGVVETFAGKKPYGNVKYADPGYQSDGTKRYPLDTEKHIRAAWSYINQADNAAKYSPEQLQRIRARIQRALRSIGAEVADDMSGTTAAGGMKVPPTKMMPGMPARDEMEDEGGCPPGHHVMPNGECMPDDEMDDESEDDETSYTLATAPKTAPWRGILTVEGIESGDGRMFAANALTWDEPPLPLMWQKETSHGGKSDKSVRVGSIEKVWREPDPQGRDGIFAVYGEGTLDLNNVDGLEVYRRMVEGDMRGNSVDVDSVKGSDVELIYPESVAGPLAAEGDGEALGALGAFAEPELTVYKKGRIRASTMVEIPAFTEARLELTDRVLTASAVAELILEIESDVEGQIRAELDAITAAVSTIRISDAPPREWFDEPTDVTPSGALTITPEGRVYGYVAPAGVRHRSFADRSVYVPLGRVDYSRFMGGETIVADGGRVATGAITMGCGHATTDYPLSAASAKDHYDNSCSIVATARVGENKHGVWFAGALLPDVQSHQLNRIMACRLSGDWRPHGDKPGWRELTAALLVPVPGFPMARSAPSVHVEGDQLVAASVPVQLACAPGEKKHVLSPKMRAQRIAAQVRVQRLRTSVAAFHGTHNQKSHGNWVDGDVRSDVDVDEIDGEYVPRDRTPLSRQDRERLADLREKGEVEGLTDAELGELRQIQKKIQRPDVGFSQNAF